MGKDTVVIRSDVDRSVKKPLMRYPKKVREYYLKYGACDIVHSASHKISTGWSYAVVLKFALSSTANKIKQKYNGRVLQNDARITTVWFDAKQAKELGIPPPPSPFSSSRTMRGRTRSADNVLSSQHVVSSGNANQVESEVSRVTASSVSPSGSRSSISDRRHRARRTSASSTSHEVSKDTNEQSDSQPASYSHSKTSNEEDTSSSERQHNTTSENDKDASQSSTLFSYYHNRRRVSEDTRNKRLTRSEIRKRRASSPAKSNLPATKRSRDERGSAGSDDWKSNIFDRLGPSSSDQKKDKGNRSPSPHTRRNSSRCNSSRDSPTKTSQSPLSSQYSSPSRPYSRTSSTTTRRTDEKKRSKSPPKSRHSRLQSSERDTGKERDNKKSSRDARRSSETRETRKSTESRDTRRSTERRRSRERESSSRQTDRRSEQKPNTLKRKRSHDSDSDSEQTGRDGRRREASSSRQRKSVTDPSCKVDSQQRTTRRKNTSNVIKSEKEEKEICNISWDEAEIDTTTTVERTDISTPTTIEKTLKKEDQLAKEKADAAEEERTVAVKREEMDDISFNKLKTDSVQTKDEATKKTKEKGSVCNDKEERDDSKMLQSSSEISSSKTSITVDPEVGNSELPKRRKRKKQSRQSTGSAGSCADVEDKKGKDDTCESSSHSEVKTAGSSGKEAVKKTLSDSKVTAPTTSQPSDLQPQSTIQQQASLQIKQENTPSTTTDEFPTSRDYTERDVTPPLEVLQSMQQSGYHPQTYYQSSVPFHPVTCTSSPASLAAFHQHMLAATQQQDQLRPLSQHGHQPISPVFSTSPLQQFTLPTPHQQPGAMATPGVWPVQVSSPVSPAQWHQLWLENQQQALRAGTIPSLPSVSTTTGSDAQVIEIKQPTTGATSETIGTTMETVGTPSGAAIETATVETTGTALETGTVDGTVAQETLQKSSPESSDLEIVKSGTDQLPNPQIVQHNEEPTTATVEISSQESQTLTKVRAVATGTATDGSPDDSVTTQNITSLTNNQSRRLLRNKRRIMDATCRSQYRDMMQEFRSRAAMLATSTKIMIRENPDKQKMLENTLESTLCQYAQSLLKKFQQQT